MSISTFVINKSNCIFHRVCRRISVFCSFCLSLVAKRSEGLERSDMCAIRALYTFPGTLVTAAGPGPHAAQQGPALCLSHSDCKSNRDFGVWCGDFNV
jgi:hypothetical protein